jgi:hypothetical protein
MARRRSFTSHLYRAARLRNKVSAVASRNLRRVARRAEERGARAGGVHIGTPSTRRKPIVKNKGMPIPMTVLHNTTITFMTSRSLSHTGLP